MLRKSAVKVCPYCDEELGAESSPEHVFPQSIGGDDWTIAVHHRCNERANQRIDTPLVLCSFLGVERSRFGVRSPRTGLPYTHVSDGIAGAFVELPSDGAGVQIGGLLDNETVPYAPAGTRVRITEGAGPIDVRLFPNTTVAPDGSMHAVISDHADHQHHGVEFVLEPPIRLQALIELRRRCGHAPDTWMRFTAKCGLGLLRMLEASDARLRDGSRVADTMRLADRQRAKSALLAIAFGQDQGGQAVREPYATGGTDSGCHHAVGLFPQAAGATLLIRLFGSLTYRLDLPDVEVTQGFQLRLSPRC